MTDTTAAEAKLREIVEGLEGVTPVSWKVEVRYSMDSENRYYVFSRPYRFVADVFSDKAIADHIARCDPQTIREIAAAFEALKRELGEERDESMWRFWNDKALNLAKQLDEARAENGELAKHVHFLREALGQERKSVWRDVKLSVSTAEAADAIDEWASEMEAQVSSLKAENDRYVIWSNQHSAWWNPSSAGYTTHIDKAGVYSRDKALYVCHEGRDRWCKGALPDEVPVRVADLPEFARAALEVEG